MKQLLHYILMHATYAFLLRHVPTIGMAREHSTSMSQVRCHDILVVTPYPLSVLSQVEIRICSYRILIYYGAVFFS